MSEPQAELDDPSKDVSRLTSQRDGIDPKLLEVLVCPQTRGMLRYDREAQELISERANLAYPIRDGVPVMLASEARKLDG